MPSGSSFIGWKKHDSNHKHIAIPIDLHNWDMPLVFQKSLPGVKDNCSPSTLQSSHQVPGGDLALLSSSWAPANPDCRPKSGRWIYKASLRRGHRQEANSLVKRITPFSPRRLKS